MDSRPMRLVGILLLLAAPATAHAQLVAGTSGTPVLATGTAGAVSEAKIRVFIDFVEWPNDPAFYTQELPFVDHVRTRQDADVHLQVSFRWTGSGGAFFTMRFLGRGRFEGEQFSLTHVSTQDDTNDTRRRALAQLMKLGLARFVAATPLASSLTIAFEAPPESATAPVRDRWRGWVFRTSAYGNFSGESQTEYANLYGNASVSKVTAAWKYSLSGSSSYDEQTFRYSSLDEMGNPIEVKLTSIGRGHSGNARIVKSLGPRLSVATAGSVARSTYTNENLKWTGSAGVERSIWPYSESTSRLLVLRYWIGARDVRYDEETIFFKNRERLVYETGHIGLRLTQPWGTVSTSLTGSHYLHDIEKNQASLSTNLDVRLFKGLSLNLYGTISLLRDQLYLPAGGASPEEIFLRRKQLATEYQYWTQVGVTYTFGSIYSNVVNPRFD